MREINGDARLGIGRRIAYLLFNVGRNLGSTFSLLSTRGCPGHPRGGAHAQGTSPSRLYSQHFLETSLPTLMPPGSIDILEIGCGSGSLSRRLSALGYTGRYLGVDVSSRFAPIDTPGLDWHFVCADVNAWEPDRRFDLIISISVLEHIEGDRDLIARMRGWLKSGGCQVHIVPSAWSLPLYLWHGFRQYGRRMIARRFHRDRLQVYRLGGVCGFWVHFVFITCGEMLIRGRLRQRWPYSYAWALDLSRSDSRLGCFPPALYAIVERAP